MTRLLTALLVMLGSEAATLASETELAAAERGADWLLLQQHDDGSWRSTTYGQMGSGVGNSALVLDAMSRMPPTWRKSHQAAIDRGFAFLLTNLDHSGYVSAPGHSADFPTYATALLLSAIKRVHPDWWKAEQQRMRQYLLTTQRMDAKEKNSFGSWPQIGGEAADAAVESNVNISVSRYVAEALSRAGGLPQRSREAALTFLQNCRHSQDGGYFFTPIADDPLNKAGRATADLANSYGTATADAILAQTAWGIPADNTHVQAAVRWLESQRSMAVVPGFLRRGQGVIGAEEALKYYYWAALAQIIVKFPDSRLAARRAELRNVIVREQQPAGFWRNSNSLMREDDPLIATAFAVTAIMALHE